MSKHNVEDSYHIIPIELRERFQQIFEVEILYAPFEDDIETKLREASKIACRTDRFMNYLSYRIEHANFLVVLKQKSIRKIVSFALASVRSDINIAVLSLICAAYDDSVSYGIITHGILGKELLRMGISEIVLSSVRENKNYYEYLGYQQTQQDEKGRIIARTFDGIAMVMNDIAQSTLMQIFSQKLEKTLGVLQSFGNSLTLQGRLTGTSEWQNILRYWNYSLRHASEVSIEELDWSYENFPEISKMNVLESDWFFNYTKTERKQTLSEANWVSSFKLNQSSSIYSHVFLMAKEHEDSIELFPWVIHRLEDNEISIPLGLLAIAAVMMLRYLKRSGFKKAFVVGGIPEMLKSIGFELKLPWKNLIIPTTKDLYVIELESVDFKKKTFELVSATWEAHHNFPLFITPMDTKSRSTKEDAIKTAKLAIGKLRRHSILGGLAVVETEWETDRLLKGRTSVDTYALTARIFLQEANWIPPNRAQTILEELKRIVAFNPQFSEKFPAIGYFAIVYEVEALTPQVNLDLRMASFYSALALLESQPQELKGFMAIALGTVLIDELKYGTLLSDMLFGLEASGALGNKNMIGLVEYYRTLGFQVVKPNRLEQDIEDRSVIMMTSISAVVTACKQKFKIKLN